MNIHNISLHISLFKNKMEDSILDIQKFFEERMAKFEADLQKNPYSAHTA